MGSSIMWKNRTTLIFGFLLLFHLGLTGTSRAEDPLFLPERPLDGRTVFTSKGCIKCHAIQGVGGEIGPDLGRVRLSQTFFEILSGLWNHFPRMNETFEEEGLAWPRFTAEEMRQLITFIYSINYFDPKADPDIGAMLFREKNCAFCHSVGGRGGKRGPPLDLYQPYAAPAFLASSLWNHGPAMLRSMKQRGIPFPQFQERDVIDILAFVRAKGIDEAKSKSYLNIGNPQKGKRLFGIKGCVRCHPKNGKNVGIGPNLRKGKLKLRQSAIFGRMWNHGVKMWDLM